MASKNQRRAATVTLQRCFLLVAVTPSADQVHAQEVARREAKVAAAMQAKPDGSLNDWLALVYDDTPPALWPVALRSLQAHVDRLRALPAGLPD